MESCDSFDMISGINGLFGTADEPFIMQKKKRTDNTAVLDIVGRDQTDQELTIEFDRERCIWKFKMAETELLKLLLDMQLSANVLSRKLNVVNSQLLNDLGIFYDNKRA